MKLNKIWTLIVVIIFLSNPNSYSQDKLRIMFYNTENLFDCKDNPSKNDEDFLYNAPRKWNFFKYRQKLINLSKVIVAAGEGDIPALVGLCEVENDSVLCDLMRLTHLRFLNYRYVITDSPDNRGINVALLYKRNLFKPIDAKEHEILLGDRYKPTRNILHVTGVLPTNDTLDVFVCHFPSRSGGEIETRMARKTAHLKLLEVINNVNNYRTKPLVIVMGDFNDYPTSNNLSYLQTPPDDLLDVDLVDNQYVNNMKDIVDNFKNVVDNYNNDVNKMYSLLLKNKVNIGLYNLMLPIVQWNRGTYKYNGEWGFLDQFFSNSILLSKRIYPFVTNVKEINEPFLLTKDLKHLGVRPLRSYYGYKYENGYSDHLPIVCDIYLYPD
ncbi:MAG: endonuclease [Bacteroidales bacterium]|nr:endonuclease [Bacteroidales bacterium]